MIRPDAHAANNTMDERAEVEGEQRGPQQAHPVATDPQNDELRRTRAELEASQARYFDLYDMAPVGYCTVNGFGLIVQSNHTLAALLGMDSGALANQRFLRYIHPDDKPIFYRLNHLLLDPRAASALATTERPGADVTQTQPAHPGCELRLLGRNGEPLWVQLMALAVSDSGNVASAPEGERRQGPRPVIRLAVTDVHTRKLAELALQESIDQLKHAQGIAQLGSFYWDAVTSRVTWSDELFRIYGREPGRFEPSFEAYMAAIHPQDRVHVQDTLQAVMASCGEFAHDYRLAPHDGGERWVHARGRALLDARGRFCGLQGTCQDISATKQAKQALQALVNDKEALLKEVHHRVKNNLQVIGSLLRLEGRRSEQPETRAVLVGMQSRIRAMALLHESFEHPGTVASVDMARYLNSVSVQAFNAHASVAGKTLLRLDLAPTPMGMDQAMPSGLLVNELISNCLQHAFPTGAAGEVFVSLQATGADRQWRLCVRDNGVGLPAGWETGEPQTLGLQLAGDLAAQIGGTLDIASTPGGGAVFSVVFTARHIPPVVKPP